MDTARTLTPEEEERCLQFLETMGIRDPNHRFLSNRGFFALFLSNLRPDNTASTDNVHMREYREMIRLLSQAGIERLRELLEHESRKHVSPPTPSEVKVPVSKLRQKVSRELNKPKPTVTTKVIRSHRPSDEDVMHLRELPHAEDPAEAMRLSSQFLKEKKYHDAYHILVDYLISHPMDEQLLQCATTVIMRASDFDRDHGQPPENMLHECEEMAAILARRIPELAAEAKVSTEHTDTLYRYVRLVYRTWVAHCMALLEYKYHINNEDWVSRTWIDPQEFGFLVEVMRMGIRSHLPLDLLRFIFHEIRKCVEIGKRVIAHDDKRAKFEGDILRIIASPSRDVIPDLTFQIYREITQSYMREGDTANALTFCRQALLIFKNDREMLRLQAELVQQAGGNHH